jgi:hypothetical protein
MMVAPLPPARLFEASELGACLHPLDQALVVLRLSGLTPNEDVAALPIAERDRRLVELRQAMFGDTIACVVDCPACASLLEFELSADALLAEIGTPCPEEELSLDGWTIVLRSLDSRDLAAVASAPEVETAAALLVERAMRLDSRPAASEPADGLPAKIRAAAARRIAEREEAADLALDLGCTGCGTTWTAVFDIGAHLWVEIDAQATRLVREVAALAGRFGWSEADLLAMPPARRRAYLQAEGLA